MKNIFVLLILIGGFFQGVLGQGTTTFLSNLDKVSVGSTTVRSNAWAAQAFFTGSASGGYALDSVQLLMSQASENPNGFTVFANNNLGRQPGSLLGELDGPSPTTNGIFTYSASSIILLPSTVYWIVVTASATDGLFNWNYGDNTSYVANNGWVVNDRLIGNDGLNWVDTIGGPFQFAINATLIPEPSAISLIFLGSGVLFYFRRARKYPGFRQHRENHRRENRNDCNHDQQFN